MTRTGEEFTDGEAKVNSFSKDSGAMAVNGRSMTGPDIPWIPDD